jgi:hypothetical protein
MDLVEEPGLVVSMGLGIVQLYVCCGYLGLKL